MLVRLFGFVLSMFVGNALAAGQYDGIYNLPNTATYISVHQNGTRIIMGVFTTGTATNINFRLSDGQVVPGSRLDYWDLISGDLIGNHVRLVGQTAFGGCETTMAANFITDSVMALTQVSMRNTPQGSAAFIDCAAYQQFLVRGNIFTNFLTKVF